MTVGSFTCQLTMNETGSQRLRDAQATRRRCRTLEVSLESWNELPHCVTRESPFALHYITRGQTVSMQLTQTSWAAIASTDQLAAQACTAHNTLCIVLQCT